MCEIMEDLAKESAIETVIKLGKLKNQTDEQIVDDIVAFYKINKEEALKLFEKYNHQIA